MSKEIGDRYLYLREDIHPPVCRLGTPKAGYKGQITSWYQGLSDEQRALHRILRGQIFGLLGVESDDQIQWLINNPESEARQTTSNRVSKQLGLAYGIEGPERIRQKLEDYGKDANSVIDYLQSYLTYPGCINLEMVNEVRASNNPTDLLLLSLDGRWSPKARFDTKRKLQLMNLSASIDRRERELKIEDQFSRFVDWMKRLWDPELLLGESNGRFLISTHDPLTWACTATQWADEAEGTKIQLQPFQKKTHLPSRRFKTNTGRGVDVYVTIRSKERKMKILKMLRKKQEDPAIAVDDDTGLLAVANNSRDIRKLIDHLIHHGYQSNYPIIIEDVSYTLDGREYKGNHGSSSNFRAMKFFIRLANEMRVECIIHTPETFAESLYRRGVSSYEYMLNRLIDAGVPRLVFPEKHFPSLDENEARRQGLARIRASIEGAGMTRLDHLS